MEVARLQFDRPAVGSARRFCDVSGSELACAFGADGTVPLPGAASGEYYVLVDGVGDPRIIQFGLKFVF